MTTVAEAHAAIKALLTANFTAIVLRFKGDSTALPDVPVANAYVELVIEDFAYVAFGGGRGGNLIRTNGRIEAQVMQPTGSGAAGVAEALQWGEDIAAVFTGQRTTSPEIDYGAAQVIPANGRSEDGTCDHICTVICDLQFDKTG